MDYQAIADEWNKRNPHRGKLYAHDIQDVVLNYESAFVSDREFFEIKDIIAEFNS